ncbi:MAG: OB-fold nucleic acid binding domain-containing protein [Promethearchaeota archaeon]
MSLDSMNNDASRFKRLPVMRVLIQDLTDGQWIEEEKMVSTRYGRIKRVRICGTVIDRKEPVQNNAEESFLDDSMSQNTRLSFQVDDGTGRIWGTLWGIEIEDYAHLQPGAIVDIVGIARQYRNRISLTCEYARQLQDPNWETVHILRVAERRKFKPKFDIETIENATFDDFSFDSDNEISSTGTAANDESSFSDSNHLENKDVVVETLLDNTNLNGEVDAFENLNVMDKIVEFIQTQDNGDGVSIQKIAESLSVALPILKSQLDQLSQDIRIYKTSAGHYSAY